MNRIIAFTAFITITSLIYFGIHLFVYKVITDNLAISIEARRVIKILFWFSGLSFFIGIFLSRVYKIHFLVHYTYVWLGIMSISFFVLLLVFGMGKITPGQVKWITQAGLLITGLIVLVSLFNGLRNPIVKEIIMPIKKLPAQKRGFSIIQISDIHLESYKSAKMLGVTVDKVNALKPDLILITGDLIDGNICEEDIFCRHLERLHAPYGVIAVTGNHEFYAGLDLFNKLANRANIKILRNEYVPVDDFLQIVGVDDTEARRFGGKGPDLETAMKGCDISKPVILLNHRPYDFDKAVARGVDVQLSGHTHGGQIPPMDLLVWLYYKHPMGLDKKDGAFIYTTYGTGYWGPPMRFLSRNEIVKITLTDK
ncbi:MAG TPA: metallophosphoesterase [Candidatus Deferrimicrobium sp.]|nr:metallophosphoesterase [Candidatus Deferrimicrobium sp.]